MKLSETGEFGLIKLLREEIERFRVPGQDSWKRLIAGAGDDCAVWKGERLPQLATTDTQVQGVHFLKGTFKYEDLGHKSIASNLSDIAAMGGVPLYALVSFSANRDMKVEELLSLFRGMIKEAANHGVAIVGGNMTSAPVLVITVTLFGELAGEAMLSRSGARPGDQIGVTGYLGASSAAAATFRRKLKVDRATKAFLRQSHFHPEPRVAEGQELVHLGVRTAIDVSDGLVSDLTRICEESKVGARILADRVPTHPKLRKALGKTAIEYALAGGEDFELLFTAPPELMDRVRTTLKTSVSVIGDVISEHPGQVAVSGNRGQLLDPKAKGWDHFLK